MKDTMLKPKVLKRGICEATLIKKANIPYQELATGKGIPITAPIYELTFDTSMGELSFTVSEFEFDVVEEGDRGSLSYALYRYHNEIISFANRIKDFKME